MSSSMEKFMKGNQREMKNFFLPVTKTLTEDVEVTENGKIKKVSKPIMWEFKVLDSDYCEQLKKDYDKEVEIVDKRKGIKTYRSKFDGNGYLVRLTIESCVCPNLKDVDLQKSYGVMNETDLLYAMVPIPGEFSQLLVDIQQHLGFTDLYEDIEKAKN